MSEARPSLATWLALGALAVSAGLSNTRLFRQEIQGTTDFTRALPARLGDWTQIDQAEATQSEIIGLETRDIVKRSYGNGRDRIELVVAYIAHSSRKSAHAQEACLRGSGALVGRIEDRRLTRSPVLAKSIGMDMQNQTFQVYYWYKIGKTYTADYLAASLKLFVRELTGGEKGGASLIRLLTPMRKGEDQAGVDGRLEDFTTALLPELEKCLP
jgi:EpsI family protein